MFSCFACTRTLCKSELLAVINEGGFKCDGCQGYDSGKEPTNQNTGPAYLVGGENQIALVKYVNRMHSKEKHFSCTKCLYSCRV